MRSSYAANGKRDRLRPLYLRPRAAQGFASSIAVAGRKRGENPSYTASAKSRKFRPKLRLFSKGSHKGPNCCYILRDPQMSEVVFRDNT